MREINRLTNRKVQTLHKAGRYSDGLGLWLQVGPAGNKAWLFRYMLNGRARAMGLGPAHTVSLAGARERAKAARQMLLDGKDPIEAKRGVKTAELIAQAKTVTFMECARDFLRHSPATKEWTNDTHRKQWQTTLEQYAFPALGSVPVVQIDTALVLKALLPLWDRAPETASRLRGRIERVLAWAKARKLRDGDNPAAWRGNLKDVLGSTPRQQHHAALPYPELGAFIVKLRQRDSVADRALEFIILTATRTSEATNAKWDEIDIDAKVWTIPAERMKGRRPHRVPLSQAAIELLLVLPQAGEFIFPGQKDGISRWALLANLKAIDARATTHGFRSTFSDWARERTAYPRDVVEMALAHAIKDKSEAAYRRGDALDKRRRLMNEWARYCAAPVIAGEVVEIRRA